MISKDQKKNINCTFNFVGFFFATHKHKITFKEFSSLKDNNIVG